MKAVYHHFQALSGYAGVCQIIHEGFFTLGKQSGALCGCIPPVLNNLVALGHLVLETHLHGH